MKLIDIIIASEGNLLFKIDFDRAGFTPFVVDILRDRGLKNHGIYNAKTILDAALSFGPLVLQNTEVVIKDFILVPEADNMVCCCIELVDIEIAQDDDSCYHEAIQTNIKAGVELIVIRMGISLTMSSKEIENRLFSIKVMLENLYKKDFYQEYKDTLAFVNAYLIYSIKEEKIISNIPEFNKFKRDPIAYISDCLIFKSEDGPFLNEINLLDLMSILYHLNFNKYTIRSDGSIHNSAIKSGRSIRDAVISHINGDMHLGFFAKNLEKARIADIHIYDLNNGLHIYEINKSKEDHRSYSIIKFERIEDNSTPTYTHIGSITIPIVFAEAHKQLLEKAGKKGLDEHMSTIYFNKKTAGIVYNDEDKLVYALWIETPCELIYLYRQIY